MLEFRFIAVRVRRLMEASSLVALPLLLALELPTGNPALRRRFERDEADELAAWVAADLLALVPEVAEARLALAGALFDAVELQRPGFPVWTTLEELARRAPHKSLQQVLAFGSHDGRMPAPVLEPEPAHAGGPMRLLPMLLLVDASLAATLADKLDLQLASRGEAGARTADWLMRTLGVTLEHARYLSRDDLLALTCVQYEYMNLAALWAMLETALLSPQREESALSARGLKLRYADGTVFVQSPSDWLVHAALPAGERAHAFAGVVFELRQYATLLTAHHLALALQSGDGAGGAGAGWLVELLAVDQSAAPGAGEVLLFGHEAPGLGVVAITAARRGTPLAHGYPLAPAALGPLLDELCTCFGASAELHALGRVALDPQGGLGGFPRADD
jgi:hypothetical protein